MTVLGLSALWWGVSALVVAAIIALLLLLVPSSAIPVGRRRAGAAKNATLLNRAAGAATTGIERVLERRELTTRWSHRLDVAGIRLSLPEFILMVGASGLTALALGMILGGLAVGVLLAFFAVVGAVMFVVMRVDSRRSAFADQIEDMLQLLAGNMRAGHSLLQSFDSLSTELDEPAASEVTRVVNQTRVGRDLGEALSDTAERMDSDDFRWIAQAVSIHRQVGGNLADVLDSVSHTIRERSQIRRQVRALSSEGRLSAIILVALPFVVVLALLFVNPSYIGSLTSSLLGYIMIAAGSVMMTIGILWMRKAVEVKF